MNKKQIKFKLFFGYRSNIGPIWIRSYINDQSDIEEPEAKRGKGREYVFVYHNHDSIKEAKKAGSKCNWVIGT